MKKMWRMCLEKDCSTVMGCHQETEYDWQTHDCLSCKCNDGCPTDKDDVSHGLCNYHYAKIMKERRKHADS
jgi:hypothetical protein